MPGRATAGWTRSATSTTGAANGTPTPAEKIPARCFPAVHRVAALIKRWLLGTHQGSTEATHLPSYMNKFVFRFNRRRSRSRGLLFYRVLELAASHTPVRYQDLIGSKRHRKHHERHHRPADIRRVWSVPQRTGRGGPPDLHSSGYMDSTER